MTFYFSSRSFALSSVIDIFVCLVPFGGQLVGRNLFQ